MSKHSVMVRQLAKPGTEILKDLTPETSHLWHMATGIAGEASEVLELIKKLAIYGKILDKKRVIEELGDLEFYMEGLRQGLDINRVETLDNNYDKLSNKRYKTGKFTNKQAIEREDKT